MIEANELQTKNIKLSISHQLSLKTCPKSY